MFRDLITSFVTLRTNPYAIYQYPSVLRILVKRERPILVILGILEYIYIEIILNTLGLQKNLNSLD